MFGKHKTGILALFIIGVYFTSACFASEQRVDPNPSGKQKTDAVPTKVSAKIAAAGIPSPGAKGKPDDEIKITVGAARGSNSSLELSIYIPEDHIIHSSQPVLKWEVSEFIHTPVKITLTDDGTDPVLEKIVSKSSEAGVYKIDFNLLSLSLEKGKSYDWMMQACSTSACDTPSKDQVARTWFKVSL